MIIGNTASELGDIILIKLNEPYSNVKQVISYTDDIVGEDNENYFRKSFRWSINNREFSEFVELDELNLQRLNLDPANVFWIEYKYEVIELNTGNILEFNSISLEIITGDGSISEQPQTCIDDNFAADDCCGNLIIEECCGETFSPYDWMQQANGLYDQLSQITNEIFGHCVDYYRVEPDLENRDAFLREDSLFDRNQLKSIKIMVPDNNFPSNENTIDQYEGIFSEGFEIHILRKEFELAFGPNQRPRERDSIYIPLNQRKYEVSSVQLSDDVFRMHAYWRIKLVKWNNKANIYNSDDIEENLNELVTSMDEAFQGKVEEESKKVVKPLQYNTVGLGKNDKVRKEIDPKIKIVDTKINNNWTIVSKNYYDLSSIKLGNLALKYRHKSEFEKDDNRAFTFWFKSKLNDLSKPRLLNSLTNHNNHIQLSTNNSNLFKVKDTVEIKNANSLNGIYEIIEIIDEHNFVINKEFGNYSLKNNSRIYHRDSAIILNSMLNNDGISIELINEHLIIKINNETYNVNTNIDYDKDKWYSVVINISNRFKQIGAHLYVLDKPQTYTMPQSQNTELDLLHSEVIPLSNEISVKGDNWKLFGGNLYLTNIRIFDEIIEEEHHSLILNQYVVHDSHRALLVDNAVIQLRLMKLENPR